MSGIEGEIRGSRNFLQPPRPNFDSEGLNIRIEEQIAWVELPQSSWWRRFRLRLALALAPELRFRGF